MTDDESFEWEFDTRQKGAIIGIALILPYALYMGTPDILQQYSSQNWPAVTGEIVDVEVVRSWDEKYEIDRYDGQVRYRYEVDEQTYTGDAIRLKKSKKSPDESEARANISEYSVGMPLPVYYDPSDASIAVLEPGFNNLSLTLYLGGIFLWICCALTTSYLIRTQFYESDEHTSA